MIKVLNKENRSKITSKIFSFWQGTQRERLLLFGLVFFMYFLIKLMDEFMPNSFQNKLPSNTSLVFLAIIISIFTVHGFFTFIAQYHRRRNPREIPESFEPSIDIFISALNEEAVIGSTLERLLELKYPNLKIYAINDRSKDNTLDIMESVAQKSDNKIMVINRPDDAAPGKAAALNDAYRVSNGEVICVLDADARIGENFLENIVKYLGDPLVAAVQAQKVISNPKENLLTKCQYQEYAMDTYLQMGRDSIRGTVELRGNGELVKREALNDVGGWNEETITDDLDLSTCLHVNGWDIRFSPENQVFEEGVPTIQGYIKQRRRWAEGSMRRYLNYFLQLLKPGNLSLNQIFDTFVFLSEFSIPLLLTVDICYEIYLLAAGKETYFSFLMLVTMALAAGLYSVQFNGLRIYKKESIFKAFFNSFLGVAYLMTSWTIVIMITYRKILFSRTVGTWTRTTKAAGKV